MADLKRRCDEILKFIKLILSKKSKEELQLEVIRYLNSNHDILLEFLRYMSVDVSHKSNEIVNAEISSGSNENDKDSTSEGKCSNSDSDVKPVSNRQTQTCSTCPTQSESSANSHTGTLSNRHATKKKRKSKYSYIQGDLSHLCREPKQRKYKDTPKEDKIERKDNHEKGVAESNETGNRHQIMKVQSMVDILLHSKSNTQREEVLSSLRADPVLRDLFMKEKSRLGKMKIPILTDCNAQASSYHEAVNDQTCVFGGTILKEKVPSRPCIVSDIDNKNAGDLLQFIKLYFRSGHSDVSRGSTELNSANLQPIASDASLGEPNTGVYSAEKNLTAAENVYFPGTPTLDTLTFTTTGTSQVFDVLASEGASDKITESLYDRDGEVFDNALHEHFQQLASDQYAENNPFIHEEN